MEKQEVLGSSGLVGLTVSGENDARSSGERLNDRNMRSVDLVIHKFSQISLISFSDGVRGCQIRC